jgi:hypothetical protein
MNLRSCDRRETAIGLMSINQCAEADGCGKIADGMVGKE